MITTFLLDTDLAIVAAVTSTNVAEALHVPVVHEVDELMLKALADVAGDHGLAQFWFTHDEIHGEEHGRDHVDYIGTWSPSVTLHPRLESSPAWSLREKVTMAVAVGSHDDVKAAHERVTPAGALPDPTFELELMDATNTMSGRSASLLPGQVGETRYRITQPLPGWGKRDLAVKAAEAQQRQAELNVEFTRIRAPIAGYVSSAAVRPGNLVVAGNTVLTTVVSADPVYVEFQGDERMYLKYQAMSRNGNGGYGNNNGGYVLLSEVIARAAEIVHDHLRSTLSEEQRVAASQTCACTGDDDHFSIEAKLISHGLSLWRNGIDRCVSEN